MVVIAVPLDGGEPITVCDTCSFGFGSTRFSAPFLSWSPDGKWIYVTLRAFPFGSSKTAAIPIVAGTAPPSFTRGFDSEAAFAQVAGAHLLSETDISPGMAPTYFVNTRRSAKPNLFRIYLEP